MSDKRVKIMVVNGQAASAPDFHTEGVVNKSFKIADENNVDIVMWCEVGDVYVPALGQGIDKHWDSKQYGEPNKDQPAAGLAISWNQDTSSLTNFSRETGSAATSEGKWKTGSGIRERSIVNCHIADPIDVGLHAIHPPPLRALGARLRYIVKALKKPGIIGGDTNFIHKALVRLDPRRTIVSVGLLSLFVPKRFWVSKPTKVDVGSDHLAFFVTIEPKKPHTKRLRRKSKKK